MRPRRAAPGRRALRRTQLPARPASGPAAMVVARLIGVIFSQTLLQVEAQGPAEVARRLAGRDQMIGEEEPERLFLAFELWQAQMLQMNLREAFVALRPKLHACRNLASTAALTGAEKAAASSARMRSPPERSSVAASPPPRRIGATRVPAPSTRPASVKAKDRLGGRCSQSARNACSKRSSSPRQNPLAIHSESRWRMC